MAGKGGYGPGTPQYDNLDPTLQAIAQKIVAASGGRVTIGSGWRSTEQQASLYNAWRNGTYDVPRVAAPGHSQHERGRAIDFGGDLQLAQQLGRQFGLVFPMSDEPWHGQLGGQGSPGYTGPAVQYDLNAVSDSPPESPQNVIANRLNAVMSILGGNESSSNAMQITGAADRQTEEMMGVNNQYLQPQVSGTNLQNTQVSFSAAPGTRDDLKIYAKSLLPQFGFSEQDYPALVELWQRESGWNPLAQNPTSTAFGIAQFLNGTWQGTGVPKTTNPQQQIMAGLTYIKGRYGNPSNALAFHNAHNWY